MQYSDNNEDNNNDDNNEISQGGVARQVQGVRERPAKLDNLSSIPRTHVMEEENHLPQL